MNKKIIILIVIFIILQGLGKFLSAIDKQYGETIPQIVYQQNHYFNKLIYDNSINGKKISIYASYPDNIDKFVATEFIERSIIDNWKPYLKKDNEVVIELKINVDGSKEYKLLDEYSCKSSFKQRESNIYTLQATVLNTYDLDQINKNR